MHRSGRPRFGLLTLLCLSMLTSTAVAQSLPPESCLANSVLPTTYQVWQEQNRWMGIAVAPQNPAYTVELEMLTGSSLADAHSYDPPAVSGLANQTNFLVKNFITLPDEWLFARASTPTQQNLAHVIDWDPGLGNLTLGQDQTMSYGGLAYECGLLRVFGVSLEAATTYRFWLTCDTPGDDVRMALLRTGSLPDGWVARDEALLEKEADPDGAGVPVSFTPAARDAYCLVVFVNDLTAAGGQWTVRCEEYVAPPDQPDLTISQLGPTAVTGGYPVQAVVEVTNLGGAASTACATRVVLDYADVCAAIPTPAIPAGGTTTVTCDLGVLAAGVHDLFAVVDDGQVVAESDETNNSRLVGLNVSGPSLPDLLLTEILPTSVVPNQSALVQVTVRNGGAVAAVATTTRYQVDGGAVTLLIPTPALAVGQSVTVSDVLPGLSGGNHAVEVQADFGNVEPESNEANNVYAFTLPARGPNLVIDDITPTTVYGLAQPTFDIVVRNTGDVISVATLTRLRVDGTTECGGIATPPVPVGGTVTVQCQASSLSPGSHSVEACADISNLELERDETDNCLAVAVEMVPTSIVVYADGSGDYPTIQAAIDAVAPGGEVLLLPQTYSGPGNRDLDFGGKDLSIYAVAGGGAVIDCGGNPDEAHRGFRFHGGESNASLVSGVIIINGWYENGSGGGILIGDSEPTIQDCIIRDCHANKGGAVAFSAQYDYYHPRLNRCTLVGNAANFGDAVHASGNSAPLLDNVLIASNYGYYGAVVCDGTLGTPRLTLTCCDVWGNGGGDWVDCLAGLLGSDGNISLDPLFCDPGADDYHLAENSPCAEAMNASCGRIGALDTGCGTMGGTVRHVNAAGTGEYLTIQHAINNCVDGDIVELADGVYSYTGNWDVSTLGKAIVVRSASGDPYACRIDGLDAHRGFVFDDGEGPTTIVQGIGVFNGAATTGAGILCNGSSPVLENLYVADCDAGDDGGGLHCEAYASPTVRNCLFENNTATDDGGGLYAYNWSSPEIEGCTFLGNLSGDRGGGATFSVNCFPTISGTTFRGNEAVNGGGLTFVYAYGPVQECVFLENVGTSGGGAQCYGNAQATFTRCTFSGNRAPSGAGVYLRNNSSPTFAGCIVAFGELGAGFDRFATDCNPTLTCTDVHGNALGDWTAMIADQLGLDGNFNADPLFCDRGDGDLTLRGDSPCAVANNIECGQVGALPVGCSGTWLVRPDGSGDQPTIQAAIDAAVAGETVVLADGIYTGTGNRDLDFKGKAITVRSQSGDSSACVIDCQGSSTASHWGIVFMTGETSTSVLERVTIRNGWRGTGAGCRIQGTSPTLRGVVFEDNTVSDSGGGLIIGSGATPQIEDCVFRNNVSPNAGGGVYINTSFPSLIRCRFEGNSAYWGGGGLYNQHAGPIVLDCVFEGNTSDHWGGAVHNRYSDSGPNFTGCLFLDNSAPMGGAVYDRDGTFPSFTRCTFVGNSSPEGAVLHYRSASAANLVRCILAFSPEGAAVTSDGTGTVSLFCSDVYGNAGGDWTGVLASQAGTSDNFWASPVFCDRYGGDYTLANISPCLPANSGCGLQVGALGQGCIMTDVPDPEIAVPSALRVEPNAPNPFNPVTRIAFSTPRDGPVTVTVYGVDGRRVATLVDGPLPAGRHELVWRARDDRGREVASGVYFVRVRAGDEARVIKMALTR